MLLRCVRVESTFIAMGTDITRRHNLTERQSAFLKLVVSGVDPGPAYLMAGYMGNAQEAASNGATLLRNPAILAALHIEVGRQLASDALVARRVAVKILQDDSVAAKVRADLAVKMLRLAGHVEPRAAIADNGPVKTLSEMSTEELRSRAAQLEDEIAARARPVNAASSANAGQLDLQAIDIIE